MTCDRSLYFPDTSVFSTNKTDSHDIAEIVLKVALSAIPLTLSTRVIFQFRNPGLIVKL